MENVKVSQNLYGVYLPIEDKNVWEKRITHVVNIGEFEFSFLPEKAGWGIGVVVSELSSGCRLTTKWIDPITVLDLDTKEKTIAEFEVIGKEVEALIERIGIDKVRERVEEKKKEVIGLCGDMPEIEEVTE